MEAPKRSKALRLATTMWNPSVTLVPASIGNLSSPTGTGNGSGTGATREEALEKAFASACSQLPLDSATGSQCREGSDFSVEGGGADSVRLFSSVDRSINCQSQTE